MMNIGHYSLWFQQKRIDLISYLPFYALDSSMDETELLFTEIVHETGLFVPHYSPGSDVSLMLDETFQQSCTYENATRPVIYSDIYNAHIHSTIVDILYFYNLSSIWEISYVENQLENIIDSKISSDQDFVILISYPSYILSQFKLKRIQFSRNPSGTILDVCVGRACGFQPGSPITTFFQNESHPNNFISALTKILYVDKTSFLNTINREDLSRFVQRYCREDLSWRDAVCKALKIKGADAHKMRAQFEQELSLYEYEEEWLTKSSQVIVWILASVLIPLLIVLILIFYRYRRSSRYRSMEFSIVCPWLSGFIFCAIDLYFVVAERSKAICCFQFIFCTIGKTLISITIALKAYRAKNIFSVLPHHEVTYHELWFILLFVMFVEASLIIVYTMNVTNEGLRDYLLQESYQKQSECPSPGNIFWAIWWGLKAGYIFCIGFFAWQERHSWKEFRETPWMLFASFFLFLLFLIRCIIANLDYSPAAQATANLMELCFLIIILPISYILELKLRPIQCKDDEKKDVLAWRRKFDRITDQNLTQIAHIALREGVKRELDLADAELILFPEDYVTPGISTTPGFTTPFPV